jgi:S1-C subfamily serine protease
VIQTKNQFHWIETPSPGNLIKPKGTMAMTRYPRRLVVILLIIALGVMPVTPCELRAATLAKPDQFFLGWQAYDEGRFAEACRIWQMLADEGMVGAQVNLGVMYDSGTGVSEDPAAAVKWYRAAAIQGDRGAQYNLGLMYAAGRGLPQDMIQAAAWQLRAAEQGFADAQYTLGTMYAAGTGVVKNRDRAIDWLDKSARSYLEDGHGQKASTAVDAIKNLSPDHPLVKELRGQIRLSDAKSASQPVPAGLPGASTGTAWPLASGYVVTNDHIVAENSDVILINGLGQELAAQVVLRDQASDIALLHVADSDKLPPALPLAKAPLRLGSRVFTLGFPRLDLMGSSPKLSEGVISGINGPLDDPGSYQTTVPIQPGNSGGPLLNMNGEVVGVVKSMLGVRDERQGSIYLLPNASCALKVKCVRNLLDLLPQRDPVLKILPNYSGDLETLAARIQSSVLIVVAR